MRKILALLLIFTPEPALASATLNPLPIESEPCKVVVLPNGDKACVPQLAKSDCLKVAVKENGKIVRYIWVCEKPRAPVTTPTPAPKPDQPKPGY